MVVVLGIIGQCLQPLIFSNLNSEMGTVGQWEGWLGLRQYQMVAVSHSLDHLHGLASGEYENGDLRTCYDGQCSGTVDHGLMVDKPRVERRVMLGKKMLQSSLLSLVPCGKI
ncbi:hypothetical protein Salat_2888100 [Sesamum alatum]|uniref:Uncharacterized protein n=1 Tax=Sesamum alatum TaxID=300844 RepID=A0AAE1XJ43_9LAMI|nr:hypothetical protein Salat_2888100 [Sesamum alatum]